MLLGAISATVLFVMMMITAIDVAGRYLFNKPLAGGFELTEMMLAALIYCGLPLVSKRREHIVIDTFDPLYVAGASSAASTSSPTSSARSRSPASAG